MPVRPLIVTEVDAAVDQIIAHVGRRVVVGLPLGLGKPVELANALYARAKADATLQLKILTALSLERPRAGSRLEAAFLKPFVDRVFEGVPELTYMQALRDGSLPSNVEISEFFFKPGSLLGNDHAQQHYVSSNYSHAARDVFNQGCNVVAQLVCKRETADGTRYSLSCNPDTGPELIERLKASGRTFMVIGIVNQNLPYMAHDAEVEPDVFDCIVDHDRYSSALFSTPKLPVALPDYAIGLQTSALIRDGGTLQVGIGALGDAVIHGVRLRHSRNADYRDAIGALGLDAATQTLIEDCGGTAPFATGIYGATEMFVDGLLHLFRDGILKRQVYDFWALQHLINEGRCDPQRLSPHVLDHLEALGVRVIRTQDFEVLKHHGFFNESTQYDQGYLIAPDGTRVIANVADASARSVMAQQCLGTALRNGIVLHGGFFLGPRDFYQGLRDLPQAQRDLICMTGVEKVNQLDRNPRLYQLQRRHARFINTGIMATVSGAVVSDGLEDGRVISGVGGQYNFVAMAHQLNCGRSIILIRSTREQDGKPASSNIVFNYGHCTIPRHLRDIVVTEYGIANLRSKTDSEVAKALIGIADSRFQGALLEQVKKAGKVERDWQPPEHQRRNTPQALASRLAPLQSRGLLPDFPLGSDFTDEEWALAQALKAVKARASTTPKWRLLFKGLRVPPAPVDLQALLSRMNLLKPQRFEDRVARSLLIDALREQQRA